MLVAAVAGCADEPTSFPNGRYTMTIGQPDEPPAPALLGEYTVDFKADGTYVLEGESFTANGKFEVANDEFRLVLDDRCSEDEVGRYRWRRTDDELRSVALETDPCDAEVGGRQFVFTAKPFRPAR